MNNTPIIKLYGSKECHKTQYYMDFFKTMRLDYTFLDVINDQDNAIELRSLYTNGKLNFPTITIGTKKLRNPNDVDLKKWINKLIPQTMQIIHDKEQQQFTLNINGDIANVDYMIRNNIMYLEHSYVPPQLRGKGIGKVLVEKTFEQLHKEGYTAKAICSYIRKVARSSDKWRDIIEL